MPCTNGSIDADEKHACQEFATSWEQQGQKIIFWSLSHSDGTLPGRAPLAWRVMWLCHMDGATMHCFLNLKSPEEEAWCEVEVGPE